MRGIDAAIRRLADHQHGVISRYQLLALGLSDRAVKYRVTCGRLVPLHAGVYAVGHRAIRPRGRLLAAVMACGPTAVLSHKSAAALWELLTTNQTRVDVTVPGTSRKAQRGIRVHRTRALHPDDITIIDAIPATSVARTIVDAASVLRSQQLLQLIEQAEREHILNFRAIHVAIDRRPCARGTRELRRILSEYEGAPPTRSHLERRFLDLVSAAGLPRPLVNVEVGGFIVDIFWPQWRLVVELDSRGYHWSPRSFETDRLRDATLQRIRCRVLRVTHRRMRTDPRGVIGDVIALAALSETG
jgi:very-short-patch-repair endonuclease